MLKVVAGLDVFAACFVLPPAMLIRTEFSISTTGLDVP